tara:strand:- start:15098 stop:15637 length:540 start_codon:yes stop_codon:yes gene_type:complete
MVNNTHNRFVEIGRIGRPRGLDGVVRFMPNDIFLEGLFDQTDLLYIRDSRSDLVPVRIQNLHIESKRNQQSFFVKFDMITDRASAEEAQNRLLFIDSRYLNDLQPAIETDDSVIGYTIRYLDDDFGVVLDIMDNPAHPILEVKVDAGTMLIPLVDEYIELTDHDQHVLVCKNLDQLLED